MGVLDVRFIRENPDCVKAAMRSRNMTLDAEIDDILQFDAKRRELTAEVEAMKAEQNAVSKKIPQMKKSGEETSAIMAEMKVLSEKISQINKDLSGVEKSLRDLILKTCGR